MCLLQENLIFKNMREQTYQITFVQQLKMLSHLLVTSLVIIGFCLVGYGWSAGTFAAIAFISVVGIVPTLIIHIQYLLKNSGLKLTINTDQRCLVFEKQDQEAKYDFIEIKELIRRSSYGRSTGWYSFAEYRYYKIVFNDNVEYIITCLLVPQIEQNLVVKLGVEEEKELKVIAFI